MSLYTRHLAITPGPGALWTLTNVLTWEIGFKGSGLAWTVPAGFATDLASIPRPARLVFDRLTAAAEFHSALRADGVARWRRLVMFLAVALWRYG